MDLSAYIIATVSGITLSAFALWLPAAICVFLAAMVWLKNAKPEPVRWTA